MKKIILSMLSALICFSSYSQAPDWYWAKKAGGIDYDRGTAITYTGDGNLLVSGYFRVSATFETTVLTSSMSTDIFIAKYSTAGLLMWAKSVSSSTAGTGVPDAIYEDDIGNIYLVGTFGYYSGAGGGGDIKFDSLTVFTSWGNPDIFVAKYDSSGNFIWARHIGSALTDLIVSTMDANHHIILSGKVWDKTYFNSTADSLMPRHVFDIFLARYDTAGTLAFYRNAVSCTAVTEPRDVTTDEAGNIFLTGKYNGRPTFGLPADSVDLETDLFYDQGFIAKYEPVIGSYIWAYTAGNTSAPDYPSTINSKGGGKIVLTGIYAGSATFGILPDTIMLSSSSAYEMYLVEYDSSGSADTAINAGHGSGVGLSFLDAYYKGTKLYVAGGYSGGAALFGQGSAAVSIPNAHASFVTRYDNAGNLDWVKIVGATLSEVAEGVTADAFDNIYVTGHYNSGCTFINSPNPDISLTSIGFDDIFVARLDDNPVDVPEIKNPGSLSIYPNPSGDYLSAEFSEKISGKEIRIYNILGESIMFMRITGHKATMDIAKLSPGVYMLEVYMGERFERKKFIKQ